MISKEDLINVVEEWKKEGREEGLKEAREEIVIKMLKKYKKIDEIVELTDLKKKRCLD